jgi:hypothetical protein
MAGSSSMARTRLRRFVLLEAELWEVVIVIVGVEA